MAKLLTLNGVPPQVVGASFNDAQQQALIKYAQEDGWERYSLFRQPYPPSFMPFVQHTRDIVTSFATWGARVCAAKNHITLWSNDLKEGEATFASDFNLHADRRTSPQALRKKNELHLRLLWASRDPAQFVDLTARTDMMTVLNRHRDFPKSRIFQPSFLDKIENMDGRIIIPNAGESIVFDAITPHLPCGATQANRRILLSAWVKLYLPDDWRTRVQNGDAPEWPPTGRHLSAP